MCDKGELPGTELGETEVALSTACRLPFLELRGRRDLGPQPPSPPLETQESGSPASSSPRTQKPSAPPLPMEPCRSLALLAGSLGLISVIVAMSTNFWFVAVGPTSTFHSGIWPRKGDELPAGYIQVTETFGILAALCSLVSMGLLVLSCVPSLSAPGRGPLVSSIIAFAAALSLTVAMAVYTNERWNQPRHPQIQCFFSWSFYLGWLSVPLLLSAGGLSLGAHCSRPQSGYETL